MKKRKSPSIITLSIKKDRLLLGTFHYINQQYQYEHFTCIPLEHIHITGAGIIINLPSIAKHISAYTAQLSSSYRYAAVSLDRDMILDYFETKPHVSPEYNKIMCIQQLGAHCYYVSHIARIGLLQQQILAVCTQLSYLCIVPAIIAQIHALQAAHISTSVLQKHTNIDELYQDVYSHIQETDFDNVYKNIPSIPKRDVIEFYGLYQLGMQSYARH